MHRHARTAKLEGLVRPVALGDGEDLALAELRAATGLRLPDCCVLLAARKASGSVLTFDDRLRRAAEAEGFAVALG